MTALQARPAQHDKSATSFTLVATVRNEGAYLLEWLAYHRHIGFERFVILSNDNTDGSDLLLDTLARQGVIEHHDKSADRLENPGFPAEIWGSPQMRAYSRAVALPSVRDSDWVYFADADEFLVLHSVATLDEFIASLPEVDSISIPWLNFGSAGEADFDPDRLVTERFTRCAAPHFRRNGYVKTLVRADSIRAVVGAHVTAIKPDAVALYSDGMPFQGYCHVRPGMHAVAQVNHYAVKSIAEFLLRRQRGDVHPSSPGDSSRKYDLAYFVENDRNEGSDSSILPHIPAIRAGISQLLVLPGVGEAQALVMERWASKIQALAGDVEASRNALQERALVEAEIGSAATRLTNFSSRYSLANTLFETAAPRPGSASLVLNSYEFLVRLQGFSRVLIVEPVNAYAATFMIRNASVQHVTCVGGRRDRFKTPEVEGLVAGGQLTFVPRRIEAVADGTEHFDGVMFDGPPAGDALLAELFALAPLVRPGGLMLCNNYTTLSHNTLRRDGHLAAVNQFLAMATARPFRFPIEFTLDCVQFDQFGNHSVALRRAAA
jgi:hypothetical protein